MVDCVFAKSVNFDYTKKNKKMKKGLFWLTILEILVHDDLY